MPKQRDKTMNTKNEPDSTVEVTGGDLEVRQESGFYEAYAGFAGNLRTWFIAFGIGAPVVLLSQDHAWSAISRSGKGSMLAALFFGGVAVQVFAGLMYKTVMWYLYIGELKPEFQKTTRHGIADWLSESYLIEVLLDIATAALFTWGAILALRIITNAI